MTRSSSIRCALALVAVLGACSPARERTPPFAVEAKSPEPSPATSSPPPAESATDVVGAEGAPPPALPPEPPAEPTRPVRTAERLLAHFHAALKELEAGRRTEHVRVAWLGDSHGAADYMSGALRSALQQRFGDGGPGFVHLGYRAYRHDRARIEADGAFGMRPRGPSTAQVTGDGVFGLGGILFVPASGAARITVTALGKSLPSRLRWDLCYRPRGPNDALTVKLTGAPDTTTPRFTGAPDGSLLHLELTSDTTEPDPASATPPGTAPAPRLVVAASGAPELCGVVIETDPAASPGVVLDTLGINGARVGTPLAWNEPAWAAELARRAPALVVIEYGTNELGDIPVRPASYTRQLVRLVERVRRVSAETACVVLAPTDRAGTEDRTPLVRDALREGAREAECAFWDTVEEMGGVGSIRAWKAESPPRAAPDGVHLTPRGYRDLGARLAAHVLSGYEAAASAPSRQAPAPSQPLAE